MENQMTATASVLVCRGCCCGPDDTIRAQAHVDLLRTTDLTADDAITTSDRVR